MRTGEVFALTWDDIDLEKRIIKISKTVYSKPKDIKGRWFLGTTKTEGSYREVYICDTLYTALKNYYKQQQFFKKKYKSNYKKYSLEPIKNKYGKITEYQIVESKYKKKNNIEMVFTRKDGTYIGTDITKYPFKIIHHELGITNCRFYDLRGSYATKSLRSGAEIKDIADVLGHSRIETTENYYIGTTADSIKQNIIDFEKIIISEKINTIIKFENYNNI